tara:strand:+ start:647 stop:1072 length:426 start_codon:yes stop_codon:yes gene_type:complete
MDMDELERGVQEERKVVLNFFKSSVMPTYDETIETINKRGDKGYDVFAEWGEYNYELFKAVWNEDFINNDKMREVAEKVVRRGDFQTLQSNFYAVLWVAQDVALKMPYSLESRYQINSLVACYMKQAFNGVTDGDGTVWRN